MLNILIPLVLTLSVVALSEWILFVQARQESRRIARAHRIKETLTSAQQKG